jgi:site-specific DNA recombinase
MDSKCTYFLYARKSTDESNRQVLSIEAQLFELREMAKRDGLKVVHEFIESRTAKVPGRPVFDAMLKEIERGRANGVLSWHPDRLARNSMDGGRIIYLVDQGKIRGLKFPHFPFEPSAQGKFNLSLAFGQSKYYVDSLSENVKRGLRQKLRNGVFPSMAPLGYLNDRVRKCIVVDPERAPLIRKAFELYATGNFSIDDVKARIDKLGLKSWSGKPVGRSTYFFIVHNPIYYGLMRYMGETHEGKHEPIISKRLFDLAQAVSARSARSKEGPLKPFLFRGVFWCGECGAAITNEIQKGHTYLRCTKRRGKCSQPYLREELATEQMLEQMDRMAPPADWPDKMLTELSRAQTQDAHSIEALNIRIRGEVSLCEKQLDALLDLLLNQQVSNDEYTRKKEALINRKAELRQQLTDFETTSIQRFEPLKVFVLALKEATILATERNPATCRDFLRIHGSNFRVADRRVLIDLKRPWHLLAKPSSALMQTDNNRTPSIQNGSWLTLLERVRAFYEENPGPPEGWPPGETG